MRELEPLFCESLLKEIDDQLFDIATNLHAEDWDKSTIYANWKVKDIFSHIIDTSIRKLSSNRDQYSDPSVEPEIHSYSDLILYIEDLADTWADVTRRISPQILISIFGLIKNELFEFMKNMDPYKKSFVSVAWAGEKESKVWFDNAREYTEHWIHQQQIRLGIGYENLDAKKYLKPVLETFIRCLPVAYQNVEEPIETCILINVFGSFKETYCLKKEEKKWHIFKDSGLNPKTTINIDALEFCMALAKIVEWGKLSYQIEGNKELGMNIEKAIALMG